MISSWLAQRDGTGLPSASWWVCEIVVEKPSAPSSSDLASSAFITATSSGVASSPTARDPITMRRIAEWPQKKPALRPILPSISARYSPKLDQLPHGTACFSVSSGMPFDFREHRHDVGGRFLGHRRDAEAAEAAEHRGHAVQARGAQRRIPERLRVIMRVRVDEARRHHQPGRIHRLARILGHAADGDDPSVLDADVADEAVASGPVDDRAADDFQIQHGELLVGWIGAGAPSRGGGLKRLRQAAGRSGARPG